MKKLILASQSPRRSMILEKIGIQFEIIHSDYEEDMTKDMSVEDLAKEMALGKAEDVAKKCDDDCIVLGFDSFVELDGELLGKPKDLEHAKEMIKKMSGKTHKVVTGIALIDSGNKILETDITSVTFRDVSDAEVDDYLKKAEVLDKAGAYAIQEQAAFFVKKVDGCFYNILGLPIYKVYRLLKKINYL